MNSPLNRRDFTLAGFALIPALTAQSPAPVPPEIRIAIDATALTGLARTSITAIDEHGQSNAYAGVSLHDILVRAGAPSGHAIRGKVMTSVVIVGASDGYRVAFSLAETDPDFTDRAILIADARDGAPLSSQTGPYRLIVPGDKREARWVRMVRDITVLNISA